MLHGACRIRRSERAQQGLRADVLEPSNQARRAPLLAPLGLFLDGGRHRRRARHQRHGVRVNCPVPVLAPATFEA